MKKEQPQAAEQDRERLINNKMHLKDDKPFDIPDNTPRCYGEYDNDPFGHCFGCFVSLACAIKTYGDD